MLWLTVENENVASWYTTGSSTGIYVITSETLTLKQVHIYIYIILHTNLYRHMI